MDMEMIKEKLHVIQETEVILLDFDGLIDFSDDKLLFEFCARNRELRVERKKEGKLSIMLPVGGENCEQESILNYLVQHWNKKT